jgi:hypothetical protein
MGVDEVRRKLQTGAPTLLVCAYDNEEKFRRMQLEGAISLKELQARLPSLAKDHEIVFY